MFEAGSAERRDEVEADLAGARRARAIDAYVPAGRHRRSGRWRDDDRGQRQWRLPLGGHEEKLRAGASASSSPPKARPNSRSTTTTTSCSIPATGRAWQGLLQHADGDDPGDDHPDPDRRLRGLCAGLDGVSGPRAADRGGGRLAGGAAATGADPASEAAQRVGIGKGYLGSGWRIPASACRWRSICCATTWSACRATSSRTPRSTARRISRSSPRSSCRSAFPALASFAIFQFLWTWNDLLVAKVFLIDATGETTVMTRQIVETAGHARRQLGNPRHLGLRVDRGAAGGVLHDAALPRARPAGRVGEVGRMDPST
jgi:hypothetical protein